MPESTTLPQPFRGPDTIELPENPNPVEIDGLLDLQRNKSALYLLAIEELVGLAIEVEFFEFFE